MNSKVIAQKIEKIKSELCVPWSEKITKALFSQTINAKTAPLTPRSRAALAKANDPQNEVAAPQSAEAPTPNEDQATPSAENKPADEQQQPQPKADQEAPADQQQQSADNSSSSSSSPVADQQSPAAEGTPATPASEQDSKQESASTPVEDEPKRELPIVLPALNLDLTKDAPLSPEEAQQQQQAAESTVANAAEQLLQQKQSRFKQLEEELKERNITVEFDWNSFNDLFSSLINEGASEVIDTIMESLVSKDCAISLLSSLLDHCKLSSEPAQTKLTSKHDMIRSFLQYNLKRYVIKYSDDPREWGYFKDGVLCDVVEIDVTDEEEINWIFRDVTQNIETCTDLQQYIISKYYLPYYRKKIDEVMYKDINIEVDWGSIDYAAQDYAKAVYTIYHGQSVFVLEEIFIAFEHISMYEPDEFVDAIAAGIDTVKIALQPGHDSTRKDFDVNDAKKCLTFRLCLEVDEFAGVFRNKDIVPILKIAGLYNNNYSKVFKFDLLAAAATLYKVPRGDISLFSNILTRPDFFWKATAAEDVAIEACKKLIDKHYREKLAKSENKKSRDGDGEEDDDDEEFEKVIKGWHVIKFNKMNLHQERFLILTNKAYWTFKYDFKTGCDEKHYKRHDLLDFCVVDIGALEQTDQFTIQAMKIFTREKRKPDLFGNPYQEVVAVDNKEKKTKKTKVSMELRKSLKLKQTTSGEMDIFKQLKGLDFDKVVRPPRNKKQKPTQDRPSTQNCYNSVFLPFGEHDVAELKEILIEIAWSLYAAAVARQRTRSQTAEPFLNQTLTRPKESFASFVYNVLGLGIVGKMKKNPAQQKLNVKGMFGGKAAKEENNDEDKEDEGFKKFEPSKGNKVVKPILKQPNAKPKYAGTDIHLVFRPEVQVFYHDNDDEGEDD